MLFVELLLANLRRIPRNRGLLFATIFFPMIFIGVFGIAFQQGGIGTSPTNVAVIAQDQGIPQNAVVFNHSGVQIHGTALQTSYLNLLASLTYEDNETNIVNIHHYELSEQDDAKKKVEQGEYDAILVIPLDFSLSLMAAFRSQFQSSYELSIATKNWTAYPDIDHQSDLVLSGDQSRQNFGIVGTVITQLTEHFFDFGQDISNFDMVVDGSIDTDDLTFFDYILPGLVIFGLMQNLGVVATYALKDVESGLVDRLQISSMNRVEYVGSLIASQLIISLFQIPVFFLTAGFFGFPLSQQVIYALIFAILISLSMTGIGLIIASLVDSTESSSNVANIIGIPMAFLAGAFFQVPNPAIIDNILGNELGLMDLLPPTPAIEGLRLVLIGGRNLSEVAFQLGLLVIITIVCLISGLILYSKQHLSARS